MRHIRFRPTAVAATLVLTAATTLAQAQSAAPRPMTFLDVQQMRNVGSPDAEPGRPLDALHDLDAWTGRRRAGRPTSTSSRCSRGCPRRKQLTFTKEKNETSLRWAKDGTSFVFLSNRDAPESAATRNQLYLMRPDGGEARRITDAREGVADYAFSRDGKWIVYRSGKSGEEQLLPAAVPRTSSGPPSS